MRTKIFLVLSFCITVGYGQYEPQAMNYGVVFSKGLGQVNEIGVGARFEYAYNCYTTFIGSYTRFFDIRFPNSDTNTAYNELAFSVNIIMFNWYPTTITGGIGYTVHDSPAFESVKENASLFFETGDFIHGAQLKIRGLYQISPPIHLFATLNINSTGRRYDTIAIGVSYDFNE